MFRPGAKRLGVQASTSGWQSHTRLWVLLIALAFLAPRLILWLCASGPPVSDALWYFNRATSIAQGHGYAFDGKPTAFWPIGYPGFLGMLFVLFPNTPATAYVANLGLSALTLICSFFVFRELDLSVGWALLGVLLLALYPDFIIYQNLATSEILALTLCTVATLLILRARRPGHFLLAGMAIGLATLVKSQLLLLPLVALAYDFATSRHRIRILGVYVLLGIGTALVIAPWTLRNYVVMHRLVLVQSNGGYNLFDGNNAKNPWGGGADANTFAAEFPEIVSDITEQLPDEMGMHDRAQAAALQFIASHPAELLFKRIPRKLRLFFSPDDQGGAWLGRSNTVSDQPPGWIVPLQKISAAYYLAALTLALLSSIAFLADIRRSRAHFILFFSIFYLAGISAIFFGAGRFHFPVLPAIVGCALVTLEAALTRLASGPRPGFSPRASSG